MRKSAASRTLVPTPSGRVGAVGSKARLGFGRKIVCEVSAGVNINV
jgi:hypothetical protein